MFLQLPLVLMNVKNLAVPAVLPDVSATEAGTDTKGGRAESRKENSQLLVLMNGKNQVVWSVLAAADVSATEACSDQDGKPVIVTEGKG